MPRIFSGMGSDAWILDGEEAVRVHHKARRELFTPLRVASAPPAKGFTPTRITEGRYFDTGEKFRRADTWTARASAHSDFGRRGTGRTRFLLRDGAVNNDIGQPARGGDIGRAKKAATTISARRF